MPLGDFVDSGTSPKPLVIGRTLRFLFGLGATFYFVYNLVVYDALVGTDLPELGYFIPIAIAWWYFSDAFIVRSRPAVGTMAPDRRGPGDCGAYWV
jgi:hypothetical protein